jgi:DNA invertase Pin-like site-specific DNA recombinase
LADFARIIEVLAKHGVSFVGITQAFNTTTSMGRLTLNVLLSFAQFEREITAERIRDKIAAAKAKGMWMGGELPLGYDPPADASRALVVNPTEGAAVRLIFAQFLALGGLFALQKKLEEEGAAQSDPPTHSAPVPGRSPSGVGAGDGRSLRFRAGKALFASAKLSCQFQPGCIKR